jgi:hypothetical protein
VGVGMLGNLAEEEEFFNLNVDLGVGELFFIAIRRLL